MLLQKQNDSIQQNCRLNSINFYSSNWKQFSKMMHNSDEIMNSALFIFMGLVARQLAQKQLQMKLWFTWEMKISIKIYFLVILWSVKFFVKQWKCVGMTFQNENKFCTAFKWWSNCINWKCSLQTKCKVQTVASYVMARKP